MSLSKFSNKKLNKSGIDLISLDDTECSYRESLEYISDWRKSYVVPLNTIQWFLRRNAIKVEKNVIVVQRLKKIESIKLKLNRFPSMRLSKMQDIGGARAILSSIDKVYELKEKMKNNKSRNELQSEKNYIDNPKDSGYRGVHLIYSYKTKEEKYKCYEGYKIEIQLRTNLQHIWATAVETVGTFIKYSLKSSQGPNEWLRFFQLVSSIFALEEETKLLENTPNNHKDLVFEIKKICDENNIFQKLKAFKASVHYLNRPQFEQGHYFILILKYSDSKLNIQSYKKKNMKRQLSNI